MSQSTLLLAARRLLLTAAVAAALVSAASTGWSAPSDSSYEVSISGFGERSRLSSRITPVSTALDVSFVDIFGRYSEFVAEAETGGGSVPTAHVQGQGILYYGVPASADAIIGYEVEVQRRSPHFPANLSVPVRVTAAGVASASMTEGSGNVFASVVVEFGGAITDRFLAAVAAPNPGDRFENNLRADFTSNLSVGGRVIVRMVASGAFATEASLSGNFQAAVDPIFQIDPSATFDFNGDQMRFADAYELIYSAGIEQYEVPEPPAAALFPAAAGAFLSRLRRCRRNQLSPRRGTLPHWRKCR